MSDHARPLKVLVAHTVPEVRQVIVRSMEELGHSVVAVCDQADELFRRALAGEGELLITGVDLKDSNGVSALVEINRRMAIPAIVVTPRRSFEIVEQALKDHVMAYLIEPLQAEEIKPTISLVLRRFEQFQELQQEVSDLKQALTDRKLIERAKGVLMRRSDINEDDAHKRLRRMATDHRIRLVAAARQILAVNEATEDQQTPDRSTATPPLRS